MRKNTWHSYTRTGLLESSGEIRLTAEGYAAFTQYLHLVRQWDNMERQQIYFRGHTMRWAISRKSKRFDSGDLE